MPSPFQSPASDRYGLGVVAWELLTGTRPFESESMTAEAAAHVHAPVPAIRLSSGIRIAIPNGVLLSGPFQFGRGLG